MSVHTFSSLGQFTGPSRKGVVRWHLRGRWSRKDPQEVVTTVQYLVTAQGYPTGVDGIFGPVIKSPCAFQSSRGLAPRGSSGLQTWPQLII